RDPPPHLGQRRGLPRTRIRPQAEGGGRRRGPVRVQGGHGRRLRGREPRHPQGVRGPPRRLMVLAHQGGWDEMLMVLGPILVIVLLLRLAKKRADRAAAPSDSEEPEA